MSMKMMTIALMAASLMTAGAIAATQHDHDGAGSPATAQQMPGMDHGKMMADRQAMMADRQKMMAEMQAEQMKLDDLVAQMNAAKGADKVDRIAAVVTEMAAMHKRMGTMMMQPQSPKP